MAFEVFVEQAIHIQKLCLSPSHYETACVAGGISRQVEQWSHVEIGSTSIPSWLHRSLHMATLQESTCAQNPVSYAGYVCERFHLLNHVLNQTPDTKKLYLVTFSSNSPPLGMSFASNSPLLGHE